MSNASNQKPSQIGDKIDNNHNFINNPYAGNSKPKFEGWPILWILIVIFLIAAVLWYTGTASVFIKWISS
ncbi:hypothetical protein [Pedobacter mucosus]|uniref:hypothetical protein n=1 Tax=Pedobacter mucosus TaxID=2895286 RepID=UPI001EE49C01|nr:hypothetical protein [Pedobacter mucosus]UKT62193.1 hypothetical protein LOK61_10500 [Pedobacter mucosus]